MEVLNSQNCITKKCNSCAFYQMESTSVSSSDKSDTVIAVCKPNYLFIGGLVALIIVSPILYKNFKK